MAARYATSVQSGVRIPLMLFAAAVVVHGLLALTVVTPVDWDPAYYRQVGLNIARGDGAVTQSLLFYGYIPEALPFAADLHWMPLPSRVLVPGLMLWDHGDQLVTVLLAAAWAPLAWSLGRELGGDGLTAGSLAVFGGGYARFLSTPDSIALYGCLAGLALVLVARKRLLPAALVLSAAALTRGDGVLLGPCLAVPLLLQRKPQALLMLVAPLATWAAWTVRCDIVGGVGWSLSRELVASSLSYPDFVLGVAQSPSVGGRAMHALMELPGVAKVILVGSAGLLPWPAVWALLRAPSWMRGLAIYAVLMPLAALLLAPAVAESGTVFRSGSALFVGGCALAGVGFDRLCAWRGYPRVLPVLAFGVSSLALAGLNTQLVPSRSLQCPEGSRPVFATRPLLCDRPALLLPSGMPAERVRELSARFGIEQAWLTPSDGLGWGMDPPQLVGIDTLSDLGGTPSPR
jgi:hypothetical protein